jgi:hypothetical protein
MLMPASTAIGSLPKGLSHSPVSDIATLSDHYANTHLRLTTQIRHIVLFDGNV